MTVRGVFLLVRLTHLYQGNITATDSRGRTATDRFAIIDNLPATNPISDAGAILDRVLFHDRRLSQNGVTPCASCHNQSLGFSDALKLSVGFAGGLTGRQCVDAVAADGTRRPRRRLRVTRKSHRHFGHRRSDSGSRVSGDRVLSYPLAGFPGVVPRRETMITL
jgi:hypothetical protein